MIGGIIPYFWYHNKNIIRCFQNEKGQMKTSIQTWQSDGFTNTRRLHWYITQNQLEAVKWCLQNGAHLNALSPAPHSNSALHLAAYAGNNDILKFLLSFPDIEINQHDDGGNTALHRASRAGNTETVHLLLAANANPLIPNINGKRPDHSECTKLQYSLHAKMLEHVANRDLSGLRNFVEAGADINFRINGSCESALHIASKKGFYEIVTYLLSLPGINVHAQDRTGETPRQYARFTYKEARENVLHAFNTAMIRAARKGNMNEVYAHIANGADINFRENGSAESLLHVTSQRGDSQAVSELLQRPAINRRIQNVIGESPRRYADAAGQSHVTYVYDAAMINYARAGNLNEVKESIADGTSINFRENGSGSSVLHIASQHGNEAITSFALAQPHVKSQIYNAAGETPFRYGEAVGHIQTTQLDENHIRQQARTQRRRQRMRGIITLVATPLVGPVAASMVGAAFTRGNVLRAGIESFVTAGFSSVVGNVVNQLAVPVIAREAIQAGANGALRTVMHGGNPIHNIVVSAGAAAVGAAVVPVQTNINNHVMAVAVPTARALVQNTTEAFFTHASVGTVLTRTASTGLQIATQTAVQDVGNRIMSSNGENKPISRTLREEKKPSNTTHIHTQLNNRNPRVVRTRAPEIKNFSAIRRQQHHGVATSRTSVVQPMENSQPRAQASFNIPNIDTTRRNHSETIGFDPHLFNHATLESITHNVGDRIAHHGGRMLGATVEVLSAAHEISAIVEHKQSSLEEKVCTSVGVAVGTAVSLGAGAQVLAGAAAAEVVTGGVATVPIIGLTTLGLMEARALGDRANHATQYICHGVARHLPEAAERLGSSLKALTQRN